MSNSARYYCIRIGKLDSSPHQLDYLSKETIDRFYKFPHYIETTTFGISCDAFANLKETLTRHKPMVAEYLDKNYDRVRSGCLSISPF
jgi:hypothetical protein